MSQGCSKAKVFICNRISAKTCVGSRDPCCLPHWQSAYLICGDCPVRKRSPPLSSQTLLLALSDLTWLIWAEFADCSQCLKAALSAEYLIYPFVPQTKIMFQVVNYLLSPLARISVISQQHFLIVWFFCASFLLCGSHM